MKYGIFKKMMLVLVVVGGCMAFEVKAEEPSKVKAQDQQREQKDVNNHKEWSMQHPKARDPNAFPGPDETSVDLLRLQQAKSLKEIYKLAGEMHIGSVSDQRALSKAINDYMMNCCTGYDRAIQEIKKARFKEIRDVTEIVQENPKSHFAENIVFDKVIFSEFSQMVWFFPEYFRIDVLLFSLFPQTRDCRIYLYFQDEKLLRVHAVMHTEGL